MAKETAEQKLLKIIESTDAQSGGAPAAASADTDAQAVANSVKGTGMNLSIPPVLESLLSLFKKDAPPPSFGLKEFNYIVFFVVLVVFVFFVTDLSKGLKSTRPDMDISIPKQSVDLSESIVPQPIEMDDYIEIVARRNIFQPFEVKEEEKEIVLAPKETRRVAEQTKSFKLVGVSWLDTPESASALIENTENGMTYFLRTGDTLNEVKVKTIFADSVIVTYEGEEIKLNL